MSAEKLKEMGFDVTEIKHKTLEEEYEEMMKNTDLDNWQNIRGPRPWETDNKEYMQLVEQRIEEQKKRREKWIKI